MILIRRDAFHGVRICDQPRDLSLNAMEGGTSSSPRVKRPNATPRPKKRSRQTGCSDNSPAIHRRVLGYFLDKRPGGPLEPGPRPAMSDLSYESHRSHKSHRPIQKASPRRQVMFDAVRNILGLPVPRLRDRRSQGMLNI
jgi:hypothetical protein